ncbi:MAG: hypothetical protein MZV64_14650 [Ignavibacteriales bacterium]|nr:hypothetical protein [Ignavibacteriales bacterium]
MVLADGAADPRGGPAGRGARRAAPGRPGGGSPAAALSVKRADPRAGGAADPRGPRADRREPDRAAELLDLSVPGAALQDQGIRARRRITRASGTHQLAPSAANGRYRRTAGFLIGCVNDGLA